MSDGPAAGAATERPLPPVMQVGVAALICVVAGGIYLAAHLPRTAPLGPALGLLVAAGLLLGWNALALRRASAFAWHTFLVVGFWTLLAYVVIAGMLEYVFVLDHTRGSLLVVLSLMLLCFAVDVPMMLAFSVARYQEPRG